MITLSSKYSFLFYTKNCRCVKIVDKTHWRKQIIHIEDNRCWEVRYLLSLDLIRWRSFLQTSLLCGPMPQMTSHIIKLSSKFKSLYTQELSYLSQSTVKWTLIKTFMWVAGDNWNRRDGLALMMAGPQTLMSEFSIGNFTNVPWYHVIVEVVVQKVESFWWCHTGAVEVQTVNEHHRRWLQLCRS